MYSMYAKANFWITSVQNCSNHEKEKKQINLIFKKAMSSDTFSQIDEAHL